MAPKEVLEKIFRRKSGRDFGVGITSLDYVGANGGGASPDTAEIPAGSRNPVKKQRQQLKNNPGLYGALLVHDANPDFPDPTTLPGPRSRLEN